MVRLPRDHGHDSLQRFCRHGQFTIESYRKAFVIFRLSVFYSKLDQHRKPRSPSSPWFAAISLTWLGIPVMNECSISFEPLAQVVEHLPFKQRVAGSNPARLIFRPRRLAWPRTPAFHAGDTGSNPVGDAKSFTARTDALIAEKTRNSSHRKKEPVRPVRELKEVEVLVKAHG